MTPGATYHGEVCTYVETWSAPENDVRALLDYQTMFQEYLFNITNTTLFNFSIAASSHEEFALRRDLLYPERAEEVAAMAANLSAAMHAQGVGRGRRLAGDGLEPIYPAKTPEPGQAPEDIDYWERGRRVINRDIYGHDRKTGIRDDPAPAHGPTTMPLSFPPPLQRPIDWRSSEVADFAKLFEKRLVADALNATWAQHRYRAMDCASTADAWMSASSAAAAAARRRLENVPDNFSAYSTTLFTITSEFLMSSERAREGVLTLTTWHAMRDLLAPFDLVPCRDRSFECRSILEFDPAPSPPPPNDWVSQNHIEPYTCIHARSNSARRTLSGQIPIQLQGKIADSSANSVSGGSATPALRFSFDHCGKRLRVLQHRFRSSGLDESYIALAMRWPICHVPSSRP